MKLKEILAISGMPGLYRFVAQSTNGIIVESIPEAKRFNASSHSKVSALGEIAIFTDLEEVPLSQVFEKIYAHTGGKMAIDAKSSPEELKKFLAQVLPDYDRERVHVSDMKKMINWYNILVGAGMSEFSIDEQQEQDEADGGAPKESLSAKEEKKVTPAAKAAAPKKKSATPKGDAAQQKAPTSDAAAVKPKTTTKKKV